jgi:hypothetical protein
MLGQSHHSDTTIKKLRGGKVAMAFALSPELPSDMLSRLIVADITPARGELSPEFRKYTDVMLKIEASNIHSRKEANKMIQEVEPVCSPVSSWCLLHG